MKRIIIIDSNAIIHRAYHALPKLTDKSGEMANAIYGFLLFFLKAVNEFSPQYVAAAFDFPAPTFRKEKYPLYKAHREKAPDELYNQIPKVKKILKDFGVQVFEKKGFEADDVIGTICAKSSEQGVESVVLTGDMDALQLVDEKTKVYALKRGVKDAILYSEKEVEEKYGGLKPNQLSDFKSLRGDPSDNIPGVPGIGEKTAIKIIKKFGSLDKVYELIEETEGPIKEKLLKSKDEAYLSEMLAEIERNVPINFVLKNCEWKGYNKKEGLEELERYGFYSIIKRIKKENKFEKDNNLKLF